jgi:hypothetical protein
VATIISALGLLLISGTAGAAERVALKAGFAPDQLGAGTTIHLGFNITSTTGGVPSPVTDVQLDLPAGMGLGTTNLGEETCDPAMLFAVGFEGCSPNSQMGLGNANVEIPVAAGRINIHAFIRIYMGVPEHQHTTLLIFAETRTPVVGNFLFPSELLPTTGIYGAKIHTKMPLIPTWPEGPSAVIVHMETTLGPSHLTYYRHKHNKLVPYTPEGLAVPERCPRGGFRFGATYHFYDGSTVPVTTNVPCPRASRSAARQRHHSVPGTQHRR